MEDAILQALPLLIAAVVPPALAWFRARVSILVPDRFIPVLLPIVGGFIGAGATLAGFDLGSFDATAADPSAWNAAITGILSGLAANGVHQIGKQVRKGPEDTPPTFI